MSIYKSCRKMYPDFVVSDFITDKIKTITVRPGYKTIRVTVKNARLNDSTITYCTSTVYTVVCRKGCLVDIVDIIVKSAPKNTNLRNVIPVKRLFARETFFYNTILQELEELQENLDEKFEGAPTMLVSSAAAVEEVEETIILQNAESVPHFVKWNGDLTQEHVILVLKVLSKFHALSRAFSYYKPDGVDILKEGLQESYLSTMENYTTLKIIKTNINNFLKFIDDPVATKRMKKLVEELPAFMDSVLNDSTSTTLIHGHLTDNVLFAYEGHEDKNKPTRAKLTEWQLTRFGKPILDICLFLLTNLSVDILTNIHCLLEIYHVNFKENLKFFGLNIEHCDLSNLNDEWKRYGKYGLALAFMTLKITLLEPSKRPDASNEELSEEEFVECFVQPPNDDFVIRMKSLVQYCIDSGLI